jgi:hypothetical protein
MKDSAQRSVDMMDNSCTGPLPSEHSSHEDSFLDFEGCDMSENQDDGDVYNDQNYLELFRRAVKERNQGLQRWLEHRYRAMVLDCIHEHPSRDLACRLNTEEYYVIETFTRFWRISLQYHEFELNCMTDVLYHLRVCLNATIIEALRSYTQQGETLFRESLGGKEPYSNDNDNSHEVWRIIEEKFPDARKRRLAFLLFHCALRPVEIVRSCPQDFNDVQEVSRLRRDIMELFSP